MRLGKVQASGFVADVAEEEPALEVQAAEVTAEAVTAGQEQAVVTG